MRIEGNAGERPLNVVNRARSALGMGRYLMVRPFFLIHNHHYGKTLFTIIDD